GQAHEPQAFVALPHGLAAPALPRGATGAAGATIEQIPAVPLLAAGEARRGLPSACGGASVRLMHTVYRAENLFDAHLVKDALEHAQIPAFIAGEYLTGGVGQLPALDSLAVMVPDSSLGVAEGIVREVEAQLAEAREAMRELGDDDAPDDPLIVPC